MHNYKMVIQYDGTRYSGWQRQGNTSSTIQWKLEQALTRLLGQPTEVSGSGRTDAGVHALRQAANFRAAEFLDCKSFRLRINESLPEDICVTDLRVAGDRFHARFSAKEKVYRYTILNSVNRDVFARKYSHHLPEELNLSAMEETAALLVGTHDFKGFSTGRTKKSTVRHCRKLRFARRGKSFSSPLPATDSSIIWRGSSLGR